MTHQIVNDEPERAFLVGASVRGTRLLLSVEDSLKELALLADTAGMVVVGQATQHMHQIDPNTFIGSGKVEEIQDAIGESGAQVAATPTADREAAW
jgi:GTP-binding protein HflX